MTKIRESLRKQDQTYTTFASIYKIVKLIEKWTQKIAKVISQHFLSGSKTSIKSELRFILLSQTNR